jgi:hypothetical protein
VIAYRPENYVVSMNCCGDATRRDTYSKTGGDERQQGEHVGHMLGNNVRIEKARGLVPGTDHQRKQGFYIQGYRLIARKLAHGE